MIKRILLAALVGLITAIGFWFLGLIVGLFPVVGVIGEALQNFAWLFGLIAGVYYYIVGKNPFA